MSGEGETARKTYESARNEILQRLQLRDNVLIAYLAGVGTILGVALGTDVKSEIILVLPYIALGVSILVSQHSCIIGCLGCFCRTEFEIFMRRIKENAPQFDTSEALKIYHKKAILMRTIGHAIMIIIPSFLALVIHWRHAIYSVFPMATIWWIGAICILIVIIEIISTHKLRLTLRQKDIEINNTDNSSGQV